MPDQDDELDGCGIDFTDYSNTDEELELLPLFPQGADTPDLEILAQKWQEVFGA